MPSLIQALAVSALVSTSYALSIGIVTACPAGQSSINSKCYPTGSATAPNMGTASNYTVLTQTGISAVPGIDVQGNMGLAPAAESYITGFALSDATDGSYATSYQVNGRIYSADSTASPSPLASRDMVGAYTTASTENNADYRELYSGILDDKILTPGLYTWSTAVSVAAGHNVTLLGGKCDTYVLQAASDFSFGAGSNVLLSGGITSDRVFFTGATKMLIGNGANFAGTILTYKNVVVGNGAIIQGNVFSQTEVSFFQGSAISPSLNKFGACIPTPN